MFWSLISGFLDFLFFIGFLTISREQKELPEICWCQTDRIYEKWKVKWKSGSFILRVKSEIQMPWDQEWKVKWKWIIIEIEIEKWIENASRSRSEILGGSNLGTQPEGREGRSGLQLEVRAPLGPQTSSFRIFWYKMLTSGIVRTEGQSKSMSSTRIVLNCLSSLSLHTWGSHLAVSLCAEESWQ